MANLSTAALFENGGEIRVHLAHMHLQKCVDKIHFILSPTGQPDRELTVQY